MAMTLELSHQPSTQCSNLGVPAPAGMGDWFESMSRTPIRDEWFPTPIRHSGEGRNPGEVEGRHP